MLHIVAYDISDETIRGKVAAILEGFGERIQESVFECQLDGARHAALLRILVGVLEPPSVGNVRVYRVCADCARAAVGVGAMRRSPLASPCIVA